VNNDTQPSEEELWRALSLADDEERANLLVSLSYPAINACRYQECLALCEAALEIYLHLGPVIANSTLANVYVGIADSLRHLDRFEEAAGALEHCVELCEDAGASETSTALRSAGSAWYDAGQYEKSLTYYQKSLNIPDPERLNFEVGRDYYSCGTVLSKLGRWQEALDAFRAGRSLFKAEHEPLHVACVDEEISHCFYKLGEGDDALHYAQLALDFAHIAQDEERLFWATARMGFASRLCGDVEAALHSFKDALAMMLKWSAPLWRQVVQLEKQIAEILTLQGMDDQAQVILARIKTLQDSLAE
jgi:tetratricopeptide (TPR) repeat protein